MNEVYDQQVQKLTRERDEANRQIEAAESSSYQAEERIDKLKNDLRDQHDDKR